MSACGWLMPNADEETEETAMRAKAFTALLIRYAQAESEVKRGGTSAELERDAWRGVEVLLRQTRDDIGRLSVAIEKAGAR